MTKYHDYIFVNDSWQNVLSETTERFKLAYLDPPYNTKRIFTTYDDKNTKTGYKNNITKLLAAVRDVMTPDGIIAMSCRYNDMFEMFDIMKSVFGCNKYIGTIMWKSKRSVMSCSKGFTSCLEPVIFFGAHKKVAINKQYIARQYYKKSLIEDKKGKYEWHAADCSRDYESTNKQYVVVDSNGKVYDLPRGRSWYFSYDTMIKKS